MATILHKDEIIKAARVMSKEERLKLIAEIAALPEAPIGATVTDAAATDDFHQEVMKAARQFMDKNSNLLNRLSD